jgi:hypothetical protein
LIENKEEKYFKTKFGQNVLIDGGRRIQNQHYKAKDEIDKKKWRERE